METVLRQMSGLAGKNTQTKLHIHVMELYFEHTFWSPPVSDQSALASTSVELVECVVSQYYSYHCCDASNSSAVMPPAAALELALGRSVQAIDRCLFGSELWCTQIVCQLLTSTSIFPRFSPHQHSLHILPTMDEWYGRRIRKRSVSTFPPGFPHINMFPHSPHREFVHWKDVGTK